MVTHNEMFLHALAERLIVFQDDRADIFEGNYQRFLEQGGWGDEEVISSSTPKDKGKKESAGKITKKELRRRRSAIIAERAKVLKPLEQRIAQIEDDIEDHEKELTELNESIQEASRAQSGSRILSLSKSIHKCQLAIDNLFDELEKLTSTFEKHKATFEEKLLSLDSLS